MGPPSTDQNDNQNPNPNPNNHRASTSNDRPAKVEPVAQQPSGAGTTTNNRPAQPNTNWKAKNAPQSNNNSRPTPNAGNAATNVYKPPPPKNQSPNAPPTAPKQQPQQPAAKPDPPEPATTSTDVDYMAGEDDMVFFGSEDEKWMMGDFDMDLDVDLGRPIDFEGDESVINQDDSGFQDAHCSGTVDPRKGTPSVADPAASASVQRDGTVSTSVHNGNTVQRLGGPNPADSASAGVVDSNVVNPRPLSNMHPGGNGTSIGNRNGSNGNGGRTNLSNSTSTVQPSGSGNGRPSAGGFSFPPGVVRVFFHPSGARC